MTATQDEFRDLCLLAINLASSFPNNQLRLEKHLNEDGSWKAVVFEFAIEDQPNIPPKPADWDNTYGYDAGYARCVIVKHSADYDNGFGAQITWSDENFASLYHIDLVLLMLKHIYYGTQSYYEMRALRKKLNDEWEAKNLKKSL